MNATHVVNVEGPESNGADFVLGPYNEGDAAAVRDRLAARLLANDPDFRVWISTAPGGVTEDDVYEFFEIDGPPTHAG